MASELTSGFGELLRRSRRAAGLTQAELAERAGLSVRGIADLESGARRTPRRDTAALLADALGLPADERAAFLAAVRHPSALSPPPTVAPSTPLSAPDAPTLPANNLPIQPTPLLGREREVERLTALLRRADVRLVTLTGPAGTGKTRLGVEVASVLAEGAGDAFADGVWLVRLSRLTDAALVIPTIAQTLGLREAGGISIAEALLAYVRGRRLLLLMDNFEQVAEAARDVAELLEAAPRLKALVTSRASLRLHGEKVVAVPPLVLPPADASRSLPADELARYPAVALFLQRAQDARPEFSVSDANAPAIAEICQRLDGLPLAIELAATRVALLPPDALLRRLEHALPLLTGGVRDLDERQRTMRATLGWSYDLLQPEEQRLFRRLAVFVGGCTVEAAEAVCAAPDGADPLGADVVAGLGALLDQSLVQRREEGEGGEPRFGMLHVIREFATEQLEASGEAEALRRAYFGTYLALAEGAEPHLFAREQLEWLDRLERERDNLRAALGWALGRGEAELGLRLAGALWPLWHLHSHYREGRRWLEALLALAESPGPSAPISAPVRGRALLGLGVLAYVLSDIAGTTAALEESVELLRGGPAGRAAGLALFYLGYGERLMRLAGERAPLLLEEARKIGIRTGDDYVVGLALIGLGTEALGDTDWARAERLHAGGLTLLRTVGERYGLSLALVDYGSVLLNRSGPGDLERCIELNEQCLVVASELGSRDMQVGGLQSIGLARCKLGDARLARPVLEQAQTLAREVGDRMGLWFTLRFLGQVALLEGDREAARVHYEEDLALARAMHSDWVVETSLQQLGMVYLDMGDLDRAQRLLEKSISALRAYGKRRYLVLDGLRELAGLRAARGRYREAARLLAAAQHQHEQMGHGITPAIRPRYERRLAALRERLGERAFAAAVAEGQALSLEEAIAEALDDDAAEQAEASNAEASAEAHPAVSVTGAH